MFFLNAAGDSFGQKGAIAVVDPEKLLEGNPGSVVFPRYADHLAREGRLDEAVNVLKKGIKANPFHAPGYTVLANILFQLRSEGEAVENLMTAIKIDPQRPRDLFSLGEYFRGRDPGRAETFLRAARIYEPGALPPSPAEMRGTEDRSAGEAVKPGLSEEGSGEQPAVGPVSEIIIEETAPPEGSPNHAKYDSGLLGTGHREFSYQPPVQEAGEEQDFFPVIGEEGSEPHAEEDFETLFTSLGGEDIAEAAAPAEADVTAGSEADAEGIGESAFEGVAGAAFAAQAGEEDLAEFGVPEGDREDSADEKILEIGEVEEYDLSRFGFTSAGEEEIPVLSEEERAELIALSSSEAGGSVDDGISDFEERPEGRVHEITIADFGQGLEYAGESPEYGHDLLGRLSPEEIEVLSIVDREPPGEGDLNEETREGIDYSDILSELKPSGGTEDRLPREFDLVEEEGGTIEECIADVLEGGATADSEDMSTRLEAAEPVSDVTAEEGPVIAGMPRQPVEAFDWEPTGPPAGETSEIVLVFKDRDAWHPDGLLSDYETVYAGVTVEETLGELIAAYASATGGPQKASPAADAPVMTTMPGTPADKDAEIGQPRPAHRAEGYTATMADIFASQGFISRAMEIYSALAEHEPENETFRSRLAELKTIYDQHPDA